MTSRSDVRMSAAAVACAALQLLCLASLLSSPVAAGDLAAAVPAPLPAKSGAPVTVLEQAPEVRGRYLARIAGCHDCHTAGYAEAAGDVPEAQWFTGQSVGFRGPWGVSYPTNLRLSVQQLDESQWLAYARAPRRPPMPWFNLRDMSEQDLRALYRYFRALGPSGQPAPEGLAPAAPVTTPFVQFTPQNPEQAAVR